MRQPTNEICRLETKSIAEWLEDLNYIVESFVPHHSYDRISITTRSSSYSIVTLDIWVDGEIITNCWNGYTLIRFNLNNPNSLNELQNVIENFFKNSTNY